MSVDGLGGGGGGVGGGDGDGTSGSVWDGPHQDGRRTPRPSTTAPQAQPCQEEATPHTAVVRQARITATEATERRQPPPRDAAGEQSGVAQARTGAGVGRPRPSTPSKLWAAAAQPTPAPTHTNAHTAGVIGRTGKRARACPRRIPGATARQRRARGRRGGGRGGKADTTRAPQVSSLPERRLK